MTEDILQIIGQVGEVQSDAVLGEVLTEAIVEVQVEIHMEVGIGTHEEVRPIDVRHPEVLLESILDITGNFSILCFFY